MLNFEEQLKSNGLKITPQRITILQEVQKMGHATIEEIYENILKIYPSISLATIYKNIISLCEINLLREVKINMQKQRYEVCHHQHAHIVCTACGRIEDLHFDPSVLLQKEFLPQDFEAFCATLTFYGKCKGCLSH